MTLKNWANKSGYNVRYISTRRSVYNKFCSLLGNDNKLEWRKTDYYSLEWLYKFINSQQKKMNYLY